MPYSDCYHIYSSDVRLEVDCDIGLRGSNYIASRYPCAVCHGKSSNIKGVPSRKIGYSAATLLSDN